MITDNENKFSTLNNYFNHVYVLTIERAVERHKKIKEELNGLNFSFFFGFDKQNLTIENLVKKNIYDPISAKKRSRYNATMKLGEVACSMGHKAIYEDAVNNGYSKILILEDDVSINQEGIVLFNQIVNQLPINWDIIYFDYFKNEEKKLFTYFKQFIYHIQKSIGLLKWSHATINNLFASNFSTNIKKAGYHDFASAYAITLKAAKTLANLQTPIVFPADHVLPFAITNNLLNGYISIPKIFIQQSQLNKHEIGSYVEN